SKLKSKDLEVTLGTYCLSGSSYYRGKYQDIQKNALFLQKNTLTFPCYRGLDFEKVKSIVLKSL
ncbi:MAG: DegT/DnrJ/EryC1/StrS family aminotransferase, partial [Deltaproteobacteria bacterium]